MIPANNKICDTSQNRLECGCKLMKPLQRARAVYLPHKYADEEKHSKPIKLHVQPCLPTPIALLCPHLKPNTFKSVIKTWNIRFLLATFRHDMVTGFYWCSMPSSYWDKPIERSRMEHLDVGNFKSTYFRR